MVTNNKVGIFIFFGHGTNSKFGLSLFDCQNNFDSCLKVIAWQKLEFELGMVQRTWSVVFLKERKQNPFH